jgi:hypothetical protein
MMTREDRQEALSLAYVHAVAAMCGMTHYVPSKDYGLDLTLREVDQVGKRFTESGLSLDLQVKSTASVAETRTAIGYDLSVRAYDISRAEVDQTRILALLVLPTSEDQWVRVTRTKLELRKCVYWVSLRGQPIVRNRSSIRIAIPKRQLFTPVALRAIMERVRLGEDLS